MEYFDVQWRSGDATDPYRQVSELDTTRHEVRKLAFFRSGAVGSASRTHETAETGLGMAEVPPLAEICADLQFSGQLIPADDFEALWQQHGRPLVPYDIVQLVAQHPDVPADLVGSLAAVLLVLGEADSPAYEVEFVAADGSTVWTGAISREWLRAPPAGGRS